MAEQRTFNPLVQGSTPWRPTCDFMGLDGWLVDRFVDRADGRRRCRRKTPELLVDPELLPHGRPQDPPWLTGILKHTIEYSLIA